jgi:hypothetical protein
MSAYPSETDVLDDLGSKVTDGFVQAVLSISEDLGQYRVLCPDFVARHSDRGLANWIHDMLWYHLTRLLYEVPEVSFVDKGPTRELYVGTRYRLRAKRHSEDGAVSGYDTQTALEFWLQDQALPGLEQVKLIVGYVWLEESNSIGEPVLSLRDGKDKVVWQVLLRADSTGATVPTPFPARPGPGAPSIDTSRITADRTGEETNPA